MKARTAKGNAPKGTSRNSSAHLKFLIVLCAATTDSCAARRYICDHGNCLKMETAFVYWLDMEISY
jgi:hypothetical protein